MPKLSRKRTMRGKKLKKRYNKRLSRKRVIKKRVSKKKMRGGSTPPIVKPKTRGWQGQRQINSEPGWNQNREPSYQAHTYKQKFLNPKLKDKYNNNFIKKKNTKRIV